MTMPSRCTTRQLSAPLTLLLLLTALASPVQAFGGGVTLVGNETELNSAINAFNGQSGPFTVRLTADILLSASTPTILQSPPDAGLVIDGAGFSVDGQGINGVRPFTIDLFAEVTMNDLTITGGNADDGGGVYNKGDLEMTDCVVTANTANFHGGAIYVDHGNATLTRCTISNNNARIGGGVYSDANGGSITLVDSTVSDNTASGLGGGGAYAEGSIFGGGLTARRTTFANNSATVGSGGALFNLGDTFLENCTISGNTAAVHGGGLLHALNFPPPDLWVTHCTITDNAAPEGSGIYTDADDLVLTNSLIVNQRSGRDCAVVGTIIDSRGYNFDSDGFCGLNAVGDFSGRAIQLDPLTSHAPGAPATHMITVPQSIAINAIPMINGSCNGSGVVLDQRGTPRAQYTHCDIGAVELPASSITLHSRVINDNGGAAGPADFGLQLNGNLTAPGAQNLFLPGQVVTIDQVGLDGYQFVEITGDPQCAAIIGGNVPVGLAQHIDCTITNDDIPASVTIFHEASPQDGTDFTYSGSGPGFGPDRLFGWGGSGTGSGQFSGAAGIALDNAGNVYVVDSSNHRVQVFDDAGNFLRAWGGFGQGFGQLAFPFGIAVDSAGDVYVSEAFNHRVQKFDSAGNFIGVVGFFTGMPGNGPGEFNSPSGLAVDGADNLYVADAENHRIQKFSRGGAFLRQWGAPGSADGRFQFPRAVAVGSNGNVFVADTGLHRIQKFDSDGNFLAKWGMFGPSTGEFDDPIGLAIDGNGDVYVADRDNHRIQKFDANGNYLLKWGQEGTGPGAFDHPIALILDDVGNAYVTSDARVQVFGPADGTSLFALDDEPVQPNDGVGDSATFQSLSAGDHHIVQQLPDGWELMDVTCNGAGGGFDLADGVLTLTVGLGDQVVCTFVNTAASAPPGDLNCDGAVSVGDINGFVLALTDPAGYQTAFPDCDLLNGDCSDDGQLSVGDINCFVSLITGG